MKVYASMQNNYLVIQLLFAKKYQNARPHLILHWNTEIHQLGLDPTYDKLIYFHIITNKCDKNQITNLHNKWFKDDYKLTSIIR